MKMEMNDKDLEIVASGNYIIYNNNVVHWDNVPGYYDLKCSAYEAMAAMDGLIGKYPTKAEFDQACYNLLKDKGWI